jgi:hypothetical protein
VIDRDEALHVARLARLAPAFGENGLLDAACALEQAIAFDGAPARV